MNKLAKLYLAKPFVIDALQLHAFFDLFKFLGFIVTHDSFVDETRVFHTKFSAWYL